MRRLLLSVFCIVVLVACQNKKSKLDEVEDVMNENRTDVELIGADEDSHGCERSAGYTWSQLRGDGIRIFEEGLTLLPVEMKESETVYAAFVLYSDDKMEMELFLPSEKESILLKITDEGMYKKEPFLYDESSRKLYINGEAEYKLDPG